MLAPDPILLDLFQRLGVALAIGFLVGVERGWKHRDAAEGSRAAGLRTHALIGLLGGVCGLIFNHAGAVALGALTLAFAAAFLAYKLRETERDKDVSVTGTIAGLLVFALGAYAAFGDVRVAAAAGVAVAGILAFKDSLHRWLDKVTWEEIRSALLISAATAIALPLLPDQPVDPWGVINLRELWLLAILVAAASFAGYVAVKVFGQDFGLMAGAAAGAIVSSTVVTAELGRRVKDGAPPSVGAAAANLAATVSLTRVGILTGVAATPAVAMVAPPMIAAALTFLLCSFLLSRFGKAHDGESVAKVQSPLKLTSVGKFALFLGAIIIAGRLIEDAFGEAGLLPFAALAGTTDVDAVTLAAGSLVRGGLDAGEGARAILVAAAVNTFAKGVIAAVAGGWRYAAFYLASALAAALAGGAAFWLLVLGR